MTSPVDALQAITRGDLERLRELLADNPGLADARDEQNVSLVLHARYRGQLEIVQLLLARDPELDVFTASALGITRAVGDMLDHDATLARAFAGDGFTALQLAAFFAQPKLVELLLERGAEVEAVAKNPMELRALHAAAAGGDFECLRSILAAGADPNAPQQSGWRALHAAAGAGKIEMVRELLARGAQRDITNDAGQTPIDLARAKAIAPASAPAFDAIIALLAG